MNVTSAASAISSLKALQNSQQLQVAVAKKAISHQRTEGEAVLKLLESAKVDLEHAVNADGRLNTVA